MFLRKKKTHTKTSTQKSLNPLQKDELQNVLMSLRKNYPAQKNTKN